MHAGCMAHARRKVVETVRGLPKVAQPKRNADQAILLIDPLYDIRYVDGGRISIDAGLVENAIRPFTLARRNWLLSAASKGTTASAWFFSLIGTAKANLIEPYRYLIEVLTKLQ